MEEINMKKIETQQAPKAIGPYSQAMVVNGMIYTSGQLPVNATTGEMADNIKDQTIQSCENVKAILEKAGSSLDKVFKTTCFLADINDFSEFNEIYAKYFITNPARSCFAVKDLPKGALCEIEVIAEA